MLVQPRFKLSSISGDQSANQLYWLIGINFNKYYRKLQTHIDHRISMISSVHLSTDRNAILLLGKLNLANFKTERTKVFFFLQTKLFLRLHTTERKSFPLKHHELSLSPSIKTRFKIFFSSLCCLSKQFNCSLTDDDLREKESEQEVTPAKALSTRFSHSRPTSSQSRTINYY